MNPGDPTPHPPPASVRPGRLERLKKTSSGGYPDSRLETPSGADRSRFDAWMRRSPEHVAAYLEVAALWNDPAARDTCGKYDKDALVKAAVGEPDNVVLLEPPEAEWLLLQSQR